jgi:hypothetical protein
MGGLVGLGGSFYLLFFLIYKMNFLDWDSTRFPPRWATGLQKRWAKPMRKVVMLPIAVQDLAVPPISLKLKLLFG